VPLLHSPLRHSGRLAVLDEIDGRGSENRDAKRVLRAAISCSRETLRGEEKAAGEDRVSKRALCPLPVFLIIKILDVYSVDYLAFRFAASGQNRPLDRPASLQCAPGMIRSGRRCQSPKKFALVYSLIACIAEWLDQDLGKHGGRQ